MLASFFIGAGFAFAAAVQPGPLQAFLLNSVAAKGWRRTLPAAFAPLLSDGPIALLAILVLNRLPQNWFRVLQAAGGFFLLYLAWNGYTAWKQGIPDETGAGHSMPRTLLQATLVNILNPNPYLAWSLVLGPAALAAWQQAPGQAAVLIFAFYATMVIALAGTILLFGATHFLGPAGRRTLILVSAGTLALLGVFELGASLLRAGAS